MAVENGGFEANSEPRYRTDLGAAFFFWMHMLLFCGMGLPQEEKYLSLIGQTTLGMKDPDAIRLIKEAIDQFREMNELT